MFALLRRRLSVVGLILLVAGPVSGGGPALFGETEGEIDLSRRPPPASSDPILRAAFLDAARGDHARAVERFREFFAAGGEGAHARTALARSLASSGDASGALEELLRAEALRPDWNEPPLQRAALLGNQGRADEALAILRELPYRFPDDAHVEFALAEACHAAERFPLAELHFLETLAHIERAGSRAPQYRSIALWKLAEIADRGGRQRDAARWLGEYLQLNPGRVNVRYLYADAYSYRLGEFERAAGELATLSRYSAEELKRERAEPRYLASLELRIAYLKGGADFFRRLRRIEAAANLNALERGLALERRGDARGALPLLFAVVREYPREYAAWAGIVRALRRSGDPAQLGPHLQQTAGLAYELGRYREALEYIEELDQLKKTHPGIAVERADISRMRAAQYLGLRRPETAAYHLLEAARAVAARSGASEDWEDLMFARADALARAQPDRSRDIAAILDEVARARPDSIKANIERGRWLLRLGRAGEADAILSLALKAAGEDSAVLTLRARTRAELARPDEARADLERALAANPDLTSAAEDLAVLLAADGVELERAQGLAERSAALTPLSGRAHYALGQVRLARNQSREARYHLNLAVGLLDRDAAFAAEARAALAPLERARGATERAARLEEQARTELMRREAAGRVGERLSESERALLLRLRNARAGRP